MGKVRDMKGMATVKVASCLVVLVLAGCSALPGIATRNDEVNRFLGKSESDLIQQYGSPVDDRPNAQGGRTLTFEWQYEETIEEPARLYTDGRGHVTSATGGYTRTQTHLERRIFTLDEAGKVIKGKWKFY